MKITSVVTNCDVRSIDDFKWGAHRVEIHLQENIIYRCNLLFETEWEKKIETNTFMPLI